MDEQFIKPVQCICGQVYEGQNPYPNAVPDWAMVFCGNDTKCLSCGEVDCGPAGPEPEEEAQGIKAVCANCGKPWQFHKPVSHVESKNLANFLLNRIRENGLQVIVGDGTDITTEASPILMAALEAYCSKEG